MSIVRKLESQHVHGAPSIARSTSKRARARQSRPLLVPRRRLRRFLHSRCTRARRPRQLAPSPSSRSHRRTRPRSPRRPRRSGFATRTSAGTRHLCRPRGTRTRCRFDMRPRRHHRTSSRSTRPIRSDRSQDARRTSSQQSWRSDSKRKVKRRARSTSARSKSSETTTSARESSVCLERPAYCHVFCHVFLHVF